MTIPTASKRVLDPVERSSEVLFGLIMVLVILFEPLIAKKQAVETSDGGDGGWMWVEKKLSPSPQLSDAARALGPFPLPKLGRTAFEFWTFKPSAGNAPTIAAIALQLYALDAHSDWATVLRRAGVPGLEQLPVTGKLADTGSDSKLPMFALAGATAVALGAGAMFVVRRRKGSDDTTAAV